MSSILLKNTIHAGEETDVLIEGTQFRRIAKHIETRAETEIDCAGRYAIQPPFYNAHTHSAMTLMRGFADDYDLFTWLSEYIWPLEAKLTREDVYNGARLAILEMIKSGTVFFNDMYWFQKEVFRAAEEMGVRACLGMLELSTDDPVLQRKLDNEFLYTLSAHERIQYAFAPHAIYTVNREKLERISEQAARKKDAIHIHLSETRKEVEDCKAAHAGMTPVEYLDSLGLLTDRTFLAHAIHLTDSDFERIAERRCILVTMPISNMKLASGAFRHKAAEYHKIRVTLGTDGASSNNNLSMFDEMKVGALIAKHDTVYPRQLPADDIYRIATHNGAKVFGINAGVIAEGKDADCILVDLRAPSLVPNYHLVSNLVYSADSSVVDTVICNGAVLMRNRRVEGEEEILAKALESARSLPSR